MKKLYASVLAMAAVISASAQITDPIAGTTPKERVHKIATSVPFTVQQKSGPSTPVETALGDTIHYDDFSTASDWTINGASPNGWQFTTNAVGWASFALSPINSTSGGQYLMLEDGDPTAGTNQGGPYYATMNNPVDFSGNNSVLLSFEFAGARFFDDLFLEYSYDNSSWSAVMNVIDPIGNLTANGGSPTANPEYIQTNITGLAAGQSQVYFRFTWEGNNGTYAWMIDDLLFTEGSDYDLAISDSSYVYLHDWMLPYYSLIPQKHADTIYHRATAVNVGGASSTNVILDVEVSDAGGVVYSGSSNPIDLLSSEDSLISIPTPFVPSIGGPYTATYEIYADSADGNISDNTFSSDSYEVTDSVYARDFEPSSFGMTAGLYGETGPYAFGNLYDFVQADQVKSISVYIESATAVGTPLMGIIYAQDFSTVVAATDVYTTQAGDAGSWLTLPIIEINGAFGSGTPASVVNVNAIDASLVTIDNLGGTGDELEIGGHSNKGGFNGNYGQLGGTWYWLQSVPMVRVNTVGDPCNYYQLNENVTNVSCNGDANGAIALTPTGGSNYSYAWSNGSTANSISNLTAGTYDITLTDASCTVIESIVLEEPDALTAAANTNDEACAQGDGNASAVATGGTAPFSYFWSNTSNTAFINNLSAGAYDLTVTDANGCVASASGTVNDVNSTITLSTSVTADDACGYGIGEALATASSTGGAVSYLWSDGQTVATAEDLDAGTYMVTVTDADGCMDDASVTVTELAPAISIAVSTTDAACGASDGTAFLVNPSTAYSYNWSNGQTTATATGFDANVHNVSVIDNNTSCAASSLVYVNNPIASISVTAAETDLNCFEDASGEVTATGVSSGVLLGYSLYTSDGDSVSSILSTTTETFTGLNAGDYVLIVADANNCLASTTVSLTQPAMLMASAMATVDATCNGDMDGQAMVTASAGTPGSGYSYLWSNGDLSATATGLAAGNVNVTVYDGNGCMTTAAAAVTEPSAIAINTSSQDISCNGDDNGSIDVLASGGGVGNYVISWDNGLTNGANQTNLAGGAYNITVTDDNNCANTAAVTIVEPAVLAVSIAATDDFVCFGEADGAANATVTGGTGTPSYFWSNGGNAMANNMLAAGTHDLVVTDANGCSATSNTITITEAASAVSANVTGANESCLGCDDGSATVAASGGAAPYTYAWNVAGTGATIDNLDPVCPFSTYIVNITDADGCSASGQVNVLCGPDAINEVNALDNMIVYPNPNNGIFNVELAAANSTEFTFVVRNVIGQTLVNSTETINGNFIKSIDLSNESDGIYFLTVKSINSEKTAKIIVK